MVSSPLSFGISPEARSRLNAERPSDDCVPLLRPLVAPGAAVAWQQRNSDGRPPLLFENDLGEEIALEDTASIARLEDHVLHHTGQQFVLLAGLRAVPRLSSRSDAAITAGKVRRLREQTGLPMMACKRALEATNGDVDAARRLLRGGG